MPASMRLIALSSFRVLLFMSILALGGPARGQDVYSEFRTDLQTIAAPQSRVLGSAGYEQTVNYIKGEIAKLPGVEFQVHEYPVMAPVTDDATIQIGARVEKVYPFWPAQIRLNSTPVEGITGKLLYVG